MAVKAFAFPVFACWTSPEVILFSGSFHLLQGTEYDLYQVTQNAQFQPVLGTSNYNFLPVLGKHLPVKTGICRSSGGSGSPISHIHDYSTCHTTINIYICISIRTQKDRRREGDGERSHSNRQGDSDNCGSYPTDSSSNSTKPSSCPKSLFS